MRCSSARSRSCSTAATWWRRGAGYIRFRGLGASWSPGTRRDDPPAGTSRTRRPTAVRGEGSGPLFLSRRSDLMAWIYLVVRSEEHTSELQSLMRISYAVFCLQKQTQDIHSPSAFYSDTHHSSSI